MRSMATLFAVCKMVALLKSSVTLERFHDFSHDRLSLFTILRLYDILFSYSSLLLLELAIYFRYTLCTHLLIS